MAAGSSAPISRIGEDAAEALGLDPASADDAVAAMQHDFEATASEIKEGFLAVDVHGDGAATQPIPLARVRRLVKCDGTVTCNLASDMLSVLARATQLVVMDLSARSAWFTTHRQRRVMHGSDVASAVDSDRRYDFLVDVVGSLPGAHEATPALAAVQAAASCASASRTAPHQQATSASSSSSSSSPPAMPAAMVTRVESPDSSDALAASGVPALHGIGVGANGGDGDGQVL